jgi:heme-degrading monooxygenase HmoA
MENASVPNHSDGGAALAETYTHGSWFVKDGEDEEFVSAWRDFVGWAPGNWEGHGTFRLVRDVDDPSRYMSFAPWDSFDAQAAWKAHPEFKERIGRVRAHTTDFTPSVFELVTTLE